MPLITWTKALETGHETIDHDHRVLVELLNELQEASRAGGPEEVRAALSELARYTEIHFENEERLMRDLRYPDAASHIAEHQRLFHEIRVYVEEFTAGRFVASSVALYMQRWLIHHIVSADRQLGAALLHDDEAPRRRA